MRENIPAKELSALMEEELHFNAPHFAGSLTVRNTKTQSMIQGRTTSTSRQSKRSTMHVSSQASGYAMQLTMLTAAIITNLSDSASILR